MTRMGPAPCALLRRTRSLSLSLPLVTNEARRAAGRGLSSPPGRVCQSRSDTMVTSPDSDLFKESGSCHGRAAQRAAGNRIPAGRPGLAGSANQLPVGCDIAVLNPAGTVTSESRSESGNPAGRVPGPGPAGDSRRRGPPARGPLRAGPGPPNPGRGMHDATWHGSSRCPSHGRPAGGGHPSGLGLGRTVQRNLRAAAVTGPGRAGPSEPKRPRLAAASVNPTGAPGCLRFPHTVRASGCAAGESPPGAVRAGSPCCS